MARLPREAARPKADRSVVLIGRNSVQNGLLVDLIDRHVGCTCRVISIDRIGDLASPVAVALLEVADMAIGDIEKSVQRLQARGSFRSIALLNADRTNILDLVMASGVQGVFFCDTSKEHLAKGINSMLSGEYWLPRSMLAAHFKNTQPRRNTNVASALGPTKKETETLELLVNGNSNAAIARHLGVSPHTVKTHLYNLFRKIGVKNRVQAVNWANENIESVKQRHA